MLTARITLTRRSSPLPHDRPMMALAYYLLLFLSEKSFLPFSPVFVFFFFSYLWGGYMVLRTWDGCNHSLFLVYFCFIPFPFWMDICSYALGRVRSQFMNFMAHDFWFNHSCNLLSKNGPVAKKSAFRPKEVVARSVLVNSH